MLGQHRIHVGNYFVLLVIKSVSPRVVVVLLVFFWYVFVFLHLGYRSGCWMCSVLLVFGVSLWVAASPPSAWLRMVSSNVREQLEPQGILQGPQKLPILLSRISSTVVVSFTPTR